MKNTLESIRDTEDHKGKRITEQVDRTLDMPQIEEERGSIFFFFSNEEIIQELSLLRTTLGQ